MNQYPTPSTTEISRRDLFRAALCAGTAALLEGCSNEERPSSLLSPSAEPTHITPSESPTPSTAPSEQAVSSEYPVHKDIIATYFWIGEDASKDNAGIPNTETEWDEHAGAHFGGVDNPQRRTASGLPAGLTRKHNPYYFALPASEFDDNGLIPGAREASPWAAEAAGLGDDRSLFKGRWAEITDSKGRTVYGQWLDTGPSDDPNATRDYGYVFGDGSQKPKNSFGLKAGLDVSPTIAYQFGMIDSGQGTLSWRLVDAAKVPDGPWKQFPAINNQTYWD
jgi:hypothetical protein